MERVFYPRYSVPFALCMFRLCLKYEYECIRLQFFSTAINQYFTNMLQPTQHTVNILCNKSSSRGSKHVISYTNHMNTSFTSLLCGLTFTKGTSVSRETGHAKKSSRHHLCSRHSQRLISYRLKKYVWTDWRLLSVLSVQNNLRPSVGYEIYCMAFHQRHDAEAPTWTFFITRILLYLRQNIDFCLTKVPCTLGWLYTEGTLLYWDYFIWCVNCTILVITCSGMCRCFGNRCTCIYCFLYYLYCVLFMYIYSYLCKDYCHRMKTQFQ
jgi:hypothetical protein